MSQDNLVDALRDSSRPVFLFGSTPPREGTTEEKAKESCAKFAARSAVLATDGFVVYDIQEEGGRTTMDRPFPFRKTMDPSLYASYFGPVSGKQCVVYKSVVESSIDKFIDWLNITCETHGHEALVLVGAPSSSVKYSGPSLEEAGISVRKRGGAAFGCVCIPERHTKKGNENENMLRKINFGAEWFITQGVFASEPVIKLLHEYGDLCKTNNIVPKKVVLTFAPCGRQKTMTFIKWLGMHVPKEAEERILNASVPVEESVTFLCELLVKILEETGNSGVPLGINVESLSIFKEEIDAAHDLFQKLQAILLNSRGSPWSVRWFCVRQFNMSKTAKLSEESLLQLEQYQRERTRTYSQNSLTLLQQSPARENKEKESNNSKEVTGIILSPIFIIIIIIIT